MTTFKGNLVIIILLYGISTSSLVNSDSSATSTFPTSSSPSSSSHSASAKDADDQGVPPTLWSEEGDNNDASQRGAPSQLPETLSSLGVVIPGVYKEYLPQPIFYESVVPAIYQYQTPQWNKTDITFNNWYTCVSETIPYRFSCPVTFHMNKAILNLHTDFEGLHPISDVRTQKLQVTMKHYYDRLTGHSEFCDRIQQHFAGVWTEPSDLKKYLNAIQGCSQGSDLNPYVQRSLSDYNYGIRQPFTKMENNFYNTFYKHILGSGGKNSSLDLVASAILSNTRTSLQGAILGQYYAEKNRWIHANQDCRQGFIPTSLVTPEKFNESVTAILRMNTFLQHQNELSISPGEMSKYYSLPLADCTHTLDSLIVRVLIPILKKHRGDILQLVHVHTIPFQYKEDICRVKISEVVVSSHHSSKKEDGSSAMSRQMYIYNELTQAAYPTTCESNKLCKISDYTLDIRKSDPCVSSLLSKNDTGIRQFFEFECVGKEEYALPAVVRVSANKFAVTGNSLSARIVCGRMAKEARLVYVKADDVGAMLVKLPCFCRLIIPHFNVFFGGPCEPGSGQQEQDVEEDPLLSHHRHGHLEQDEPERYLEQVEVSSIIPFMFAKAKSKSGSGHVQKPSSLEKTANSVTHPDNYDDIDPEEFGQGQQLNLTEVIDTERIENYIEASKVRRKIEESRKRNKGMDYYAEMLRDGSISSHEDLHLGENNSRGLGGVFWGVFFTSLLLLLSLQIYIIVMFKRNERASYLKDERILYRVAEPDTASIG